MAITISGVNNNDRIVASDGTIDALSGFNVVGVMTATSFSGDLIGNVTGNVTGNINNTTLLLQTSGTERIRITGNNEIGIAGANYGSAGQVLTSGGSGSAVSWTTISGGVTSDSQENTVGGTSAGNALDSDTYRNTLFGYDTGKLINSGDDNTIIGWKAGDAITSGYKNCAVGSEALPNCNSGHNNVAMGWEAGRSLTSGNNNVMLGPMAGRTIGGGTYNIALGYHSLSNVGSPTRCIGIGGDSVFLGGTDVIGMGQGTMMRGNSQIGGIGIGRYAGRNNAGDYNVYVGYEAGHGTNSSPYSQGNYNISLGYRSLYNITSASSNVAIGSSAGDVLTTGGNNIILGDGADASSATVSNEVTIGNSSINHLRVPGIGVTFATSGNHITGITTFSDRIKLGNSGNGQLYYSGGIKMISAAQIELESANQLYIHAQSSGLFLRASNQEVISVYGGSGGGVYFRHDGNQKLKLEGGNWTYQGGATVTFDNHLYIPDSIIHVGDTNTKIRFPEPDKISFETGGTERLRIDNVGVLYTGNYTTTLDATPGSIQMSGGTSGARLSLRGTTTSAYGGLGEIHGFWDTNKVASILFHAGSDTSNKDDGEIRMYTRTSGGGTSARLRIDSSGRSLFRTNGSQTSAITDDNVPIQIAESTANMCYIGLNKGNSYGSIIGHHTAYGGTVFRNLTSDDFSFRTNNTAEKFKIASGGDVTVSTGNLVIGTSGKGIDFAATANSGQSEVFDDYEEGLWTPTISGATGTFSGQYTKIGNRLFWALQITSLGGSGGFHVQGLPYAVAGGWGGNISISDNNHSPEHIYCFAHNSSSDIYFRNDQNSTYNVSTFSGHFFYCNGVYQTT